MSFLEGLSQALKTYSKGAPFYNAWLTVLNVPVLRSLIGRVVRQPRNQLLQLRVLRLSLFQNGDVGVGVFPEREEVLIGGLCLGGVTLQVVGTA